jgi:hypothetical protein
MFWPRSWKASSLFILTSKDFEMAEVKARVKSSGKLPSVVAHNVVGLVSGAQTTICRNEKVGKYLFFARHLEDQQHVCQCCQIL